MGALILILPVLAFDVWLFVTIGKKQFQTWAQDRRWWRLAGCVVAGVVAGLCLAFFVRYKWDNHTRFIGFPLPVAFSNLEKGVWGPFAPPAPPLRCGGMVINFLTGLAAPLVPFKIAEFLRTVKTEL